MERTIGQSPGRDQTSPVSRTTWLGHGKDRPVASRRTGPPHPRPHRERQRPGPRSTPAVRQSAEQASEDPCPACEQTCAKSVLAKQSPERALRRALAESVQQRLRKTKGRGGWHSPRSLSPWKVCGAQECQSQCARGHHDDDTRDPPGTLILAAKGLVTGAQRWGNMGTAAGTATATGRATVVTAGTPPSAPLPGTTQRPSECQGLQRPSPRRSSGGGEGSCPG